MKKHLLLVGVAVMLVGSLFSFTKKNATADKINWLTIEEAYAKTQIQPRKTIIDVYTDWCGWCKVMDKKTFTNPEIIDYVNKNFYAVKFNAESTADVQIGTQKFGFDSANKVNQAAIALLGGKLSYPTTVYLDEKFNMIQPVPGYQDTKNFHQIITYLGTNNNTKQAYDKYLAGTYKTQFKTQITKL